MFKIVKNEYRLKQNTFVVNLINFFSPFLYIFVHNTYSFNSNFYISIGKSFYFFKLVQLISTYVILKD